ncbi:MAG: DUF2292 domain-containing protein, partial [Actinomycetota bacterium]
AAVSERAIEIERDGPFEDVTEEEWEVLLKVAHILRRTRFGTIALIVHDGRVKQIERAEKIRLR